jgi:hypothetical protein
MYRSALRWGLRDAGEQMLLMWGVKPLACPADTRKRDTNILCRGVTACETGDGSGVQQWW